MKKYWTKFISMGMALVLLVMPGAGFANEQSPVSMVINGDLVRMDEEIGRPYFASNQRLMLPLRAVNVCLGYDTVWKKDGTIHIRSSHPSIDVTMKIGAEDGVYNGKKIHFLMPIVINKAQGRCYISLEDFNQLYALAQWDEAARQVVVYPTKNSPAHYRIVDGVIEKEANGESVKLSMPSHPDANLQGIEVQRMTVVQKRDQNNLYLAVKVRDAVNNLCSVFRDEGDCASFLGVINASSSYAVDGTTLYHTEGTEAGAFTDQINPRVLLITDLTGKTPVKEVECHFEINQCVLYMDGHRLLAVKPDGECVAVDVS